MGSLPNHTPKRGDIKSTATPWPPKRAVYILLALVLLFSAAIRYGRLDVPLERDEGEYAYAGQLMLQGMAPYEHVYNMKFPGIYAAYAVVLLLFGETHTGIHLALLIINSLTSLLVFLLARRFVDDLPAVASAAVFAFMSLGRPVQGFHANAEHFVILFAVAGLYTLVTGLEKKRTPLIFFAGILLGTGVLMKQHGAVFAALALCFIPLKLRSEQVADRYTSLRYAGWFISGNGVVLLVVVAALIHTGTFGRFWFWTVEYARTYVSGIPLHMALSRLMPRLSGIFHSAPMLAALSGLGLVYLFSRKIDGVDRRFILLLVLFSILSVCPGFYFRPHYFVLTLPAVAILSGVAIQGLSHSPFTAETHAAKRGVVAIVIFLACLGHTVFVQREYFFSMTPLQVSRATYWLNPFPESIEIAEFIKGNTAEDDPIAVLGSEPQIYFYAQRKSSSGFIYMYHMMEEHEYALQMQKTFVEELETHPPSCLVYVNVPTSWSLRRNSNRFLFEWFEKYRVDKLELKAVLELHAGGAPLQRVSEQIKRSDHPYWVAIFTPKETPEGHD